MEFSFTEEQLAVQQAAREFAQKDLAMRQISLCKKELWLLHNPQYGVC